ncbi:MAG: ATP-binding protein [Armatimonadetes bacterium]|nr:ATP-binding protein [Armatimonadota bacterium]
MKTPATELLERIPQMTGQEFIDEEWSENDWLEFKTIHRGNDDWKDVLKKNFTKAACAFANGSGGMIVWGIKCSSDKATKIVPIEEIEEVHRHLDGWSYQITEQPIQGIRHGKFDANNLIYTYVPESSIAPHRSVLDEVFYMRSGSNSIKMPFRMIQSMFLARQKGRVSIEINAEKLFDFSPKLEIRIINTGSIVLSEPVLFYSAQNIECIHPQLSGEYKSVFPKELFHNAKLPPIIAPYQIITKDIGEFKGRSAQALFHLVDKNTTIGFSFRIPENHYNKCRDYASASSPWIELPALSEVEFQTALLDDRHFSPYFLDVERGTGRLFINKVPE